MSLTMNIEGSSLLAVDCNFLTNSGDCYAKKERLPRNTEPIVVVNQDTANLPKCCVISCKECPHEQGRTGYWDLP